MQLNDRIIKSAKPTGKIYKLTDGGGMYLKITAKGSKVFCFDFAFNGKRQTLTIGGYPAVSLSEARIKADEARNQINQGINPCEVKQQAKQQAKQAALNTFAAIAKEWHRVNTPKWKPNHAMRIWRYIENDVLPYLGGKHIDKIKVLDIQAVLERIQSRNVSNTAEKIRQWIGAIYEYAAQRELTERNPARRLKGFVQKKETVHRRALPLPELKEFYSRLENAKIQKQNHIALLLLILTFPRSNELRGAKWQEIDFQAAIWTIPAERMKHEKSKPKPAHKIPLSDWSIQLLHELHQHTGNTPFLFPSRTKLNESISEATLTRIMERLGYKGIATPHGFRSLASSLLNEQGFNSDAIERQLAHIETNAIRAAYNRADYWSERVEFMQWYSDFLKRHHNNALKAISQA